MIILLIQALTKISANTFVFFNRKVSQSYVYINRVKLCVTLRLKKFHTVGIKKTFYRKIIEETHEMSKMFIYP
jgi:hypothetical protein